LPTAAALNTPAEPAPAATSSPPQPQPPRPLPTAVALPTASPLPDLSLNPPFLPLPPLPVPSTHHHEQTPPPRRRKRTKCIEAPVAAASIQASVVAAEQHGLTLLHAPPSSDDTTASTAAAATAPGILQPLLPPQPPSAAMIQVEARLFSTVPHSASLQLLALPAHHTTVYSLPSASVGHRSGVADAVAVYTETAAARTRQGTSSRHGGVDRPAGAMPLGSNQRGRRPVLKLPASIGQQPCGHQVRPQLEAHRMVSFLA
jgi:hypothetical protein